jgi:hypothetical protein
MARIPKLDDITITISERQAQGILDGRFPDEVLLGIPEIDNWIVISKVGVGEIFITCERQTLNLIHWLNRGENVFTLKICNSAPGPFATSLRYRIADQPWHLLLAIRRSAEVPCMITRNLVITSPVDFSRRRELSP